MKSVIFSSRRLLSAVIHLAAWGVFILLPYLIMRQDQTPQAIAMEHNPYFIFIEFFTNAYLIAFYYLNSLVLIPRLLANKRILVYALIIVVLLVVYVYVPEYIFRNFIFLHPQRPGGPPRHRFRIFPLPGSAALFLLIFVISSGVKIIQQWFSAEQLKEKAEKEKLRTELSLLKSQVNPHFLFNTLNNIYAMAITQSENTAGAVMKLSQIMRYILQDAESEFVPLQKDIEFLQRYIELQQFRLSDKVDIQFNITGGPDNLRIAPLLLIPFVENAFKYGVSAREKSRILMNIDIQGNIVTLSVENSKHAGTAALSKDNTGIGISNTRRRLALLYPDKHELTIQDTPEQFLVTLKIICG
jgi:two-component system, LytTR family, sensor kinase